MGTLITLKKDKKNVAQNSGIRIEAIDLQGLKTTYYELVCPPIWIQGVTIDYFSSSVIF
jgi:hypothetical protein